MENLKARVKKKFWEIVLLLRGGKCPTTKGYFPLATRTGCRACRLEKQLTCSFLSASIDQMSTGERTKFKEQVKDDLGLVDEIPEDITKEQLAKNLSGDAFEHIKELKGQEIKIDKRRKAKEKIEKRKISRGKLFAKTDSVFKAVARFADWVEKTLSDFLSLLFNVGTASGILAATFAGVVALYEGEWIIALCSVPIIAVLGWVNMNAGEKEEAPPPRSHSFEEE